MAVSKINDTRFDDLPLEISAAILRELPYKSIIYSSEASATLDAAAQNFSFWKYLCCRDFPIKWKLLEETDCNDSDEEMEKRKINWKDEYERMYLQTPVILSQTIKAHTDEVIHVKFSHDGSKFVTCSKDAKMIIWNAKGFPIKKLYSANMRDYSWKYTQYAEFNKDDTFLLVSGVNLGNSAATMGQIAIFKLKPTFKMISKPVINKPYDIFGTWYSNDVFLSGNFHFQGEICTCSTLFLNRIVFSERKKFEIVSTQLFRVFNENGSSVRMLRIATPKELQNANAMHEDRLITDSENDSHVKSLPRFSNDEHHASGQFVFKNQKKTQDEVSLLSSNQRKPGSELFSDYGHLISTDQVSIAQKRRQLGHFLPPPPRVVLQALRHKHNQNSSSNNKNRIKKSSPYSVTDGGNKVSMPEDCKKSSGDSEINSHTSAESHMETDDGASDESKEISTQSASSHDTSFDVSEDGYSGSSSNLDTGSADEDSLSDLPVTSDVAEFMPEKSGQDIEVYKPQNISEYSDDVKFLTKVQIFDDEKEFKESNSIQPSSKRILIFTMGDSTYVPHQLAFTPLRDDDTYGMIDSVAMRINNGYHKPFIINMHGHIIGMETSPDDKYLFVNLRPWPEDAEVTDPFSPPVISKDIEIHVFDLTTPDFKKVGQKFRSHKAYTSNDECFFIFLDVSKNFVVSGAEDNFGHIWDRKFGVPLGKFQHEKVVNAVAFNPVDEETLVTVSDDFTIKIWRSRRRHVEIAKFLSKERTAHSELSSSDILRFIDNKLLKSQETIYIGDNETSNWVSVETCEKNE